MNRFDERYEIRMGRYEEIPQIMEFIDSHWKKGHILATDRAFFEYEFLEEDGTVNFILAIDKEKGTIESINGVLKASHDSNHLDIWGSILKTLDGNMGMLGMELIKRRPQLTGCRNELGVGDNPQTAVPLFRTLLHRYTAKMNHHYMVADRRDYHIAKVQNNPKKAFSSEVRYRVIRIETMEKLQRVFDLSQYKDTVPYKDDWYVEHRFFNHPLQKYEVYGIEKNGKVTAVFILRRQEYGGRIAVRLVDYFGNREAIAGTEDFWKMILADENTEYVDFYELGFEREYLESAGFVLRGEQDPNIIPNYFAPFVQENIEIWVDSTSPEALFFKGDSDQDRPNKATIQI